MYTLTSFICRWTTLHALINPFKFSNMSQTNSIPKSGSHLITLQAAEALTATFRTNRETILATAYQNKNVLPLSETFNVSDIQALLAQTGCAAIRVYYGMKDDDTVHAVIVAVNAANEDIIFPGQNTLLSEENIIIEEGQRCPVICPPDSPLNS